LLFDNTGPAPTILDTISTGTSFGFATAISPNNTQVAVACSNGKLKVYNLANSQLVHDINAHISWVTTVAYSPNGNTLVTGGNDDRVKVWSNSGTLLHTLMGHTGDITQVKITPDNSHIVSASKDNSIKIWNLATGALERTLTIHTTDVLSIDPSPDGSKWVSSAADGNCILWEWSSGNALATFGVPDSGAVNSVAWSPTGSHIAAGNASSDVMLWGVSSIVGIENPVNNPNEQVLVYPNPTQNQLWLTLPANQVTERIALTDLQGRVVVEVFGDQTSIDIHALPTGTYLLSVFVHQQPAHTQIVIKQ
jgi:WD40 repeat protein